MTNKEQREYKIEVCVETYDEAINAAHNGADQIELCSSLDEDGLTPSIDLFKKCQANLDILIKVMIRPRAGDFEYSLDEIDEMLQSIRAFRNAGAMEIVTGMIRGKQLDMDLLVKLMEAAGSMSVSVHKAIDECIDPVTEVTRLKEMGIKSILTSGGAQTALKGKYILKEMIKEAEGILEIIPAGKILPTNIEDLHKELNATTYHGRNIL